MGKNQEKEGKRVLLPEQSLWFGGEGGSSFVLKMRRLIFDVSLLPEQSLMNVFEVVRVVLHLLEDATTIFRSVASVMTFSIGRILSVFVLRRRRRVLQRSSVKSDCRAHGLSEC